MNTSPLARVWFTPTRGASNWLWLSFFVVLLDQVTKALVIGTVKLQDSITLLPILDIVHLRNTGAAFSILADASGWQRWFFIVLALGVSVVLMVWLRRIRADQTMLAVGLSLVLGGALGNVIDRVLHGHVVDFIYFHWRTWYFPAFNLADTAISIGAACLLFDAFRESGHDRRAQDNTSRRRASDGAPGGSGQGSSAASGAGDGGSAPGSGPGSGSQGDTASDGNGPGGRGHGGGVPGGEAAGSGHHRDAAG